MIHITGQNFNAREIIQNVFSPLVGVITSPLTDEMCYKNNLTFVEMLQPFSKLANDANFRDISNTSVSIKGLRLNICDIGWRPPQTILARKMLNEAVANGAYEATTTLQAGGIDIEIPASEPWFENWRESFLTVQFPADHEFTRHFLSCLIVLGSSDPNLLDTAHQLTKKVQILQNVTPQKLPKWFQPNDVLNSYVLLHEGSQSDISKVQQSYEMLKSTFGENKCFLVQINSSTEVCSDNVDPWQKFIKRQPKSDTQSDQSSAPKTPQDSSVSAMPTITSESTLAPESFVHPLSPVQDQATEAIHSKFSTSSESINSQNINPNVWANEMDTDLPHGTFLTPSDIDNLRHFVQDYTVRALIPYAEKLVGILNEAITNKKGVSKSLLSATKRLFAASKPVAGSGTQNAVIYTNESSELQTRKLGDLYFLFGHYNLAFQAYHQAKRDFNADSAWQYFAGALEMAALSAFMLGTANRKTYDYMENAIECYLTYCRLQQFATRATLLSIECLKNARLYGEAAKQLIRMTSEDSDLRSALLLEQASYCFLQSQPRMYRKYAFHIVLSGNRYSRCGQRKHAFRCYKQAYQIFQDRGWSLAEDHIQYTIGKQAVTLKKLDIASKSLAHLLRPTSLQNITQQAAFLREYIATQKELLVQAPEIGLLEIALPKVKQSSIRVLVTSHPPVATPQFISATNINIKSNLKDEWIWQKLEEMVVSTASSKVMVFKPSRYLFTNENLTTEFPMSIHGDPIEISVALLNTIKPSITFTDINLLWQFTLESGEKISNRKLFEHNCSPGEINSIQAAILTTDNQEIILNENEETIVKFKLIPKLIGDLNIVGIVGQMSATNEVGGLQGCMYFEPQQIKKMEKASAIEKLPQFDNKLTIKILPPAPTVHVSFTQITTDILVGEIIPVTISMKNTGTQCIREVYICSENPRSVTFLDDSVELPLSILRDYKDLKNATLSKDKEIRKQHVIKLFQKNSEEALSPQETKMQQMWIQAPYQKGEFKLRLLIYYTMPENYEKIKYRLVRHEWDFNVIECLQAEVSCVIRNLNTNELGLDVNVKNLEIDKRSTELYLNSIHMYSSKYKLSQDKIIYINDMALTDGQISTDPKSNKCMKPCNAASCTFRVKLNDSQIEINTLSPVEYVTERMSSHSIQPMVHNYQANIPQFEKLYSFLIKQETKFLNVFNVNVSTEEFNQLLSTHDPHMTITITWSALVHDNNTSTNRIAVGQHFIQLRNLYQQVSCPETADYRVQTYLGDHPKYKKIHDFKNENQLSTVNLDEIDDDQWEQNSFYVGKRCLLEDESFSNVVLSKSGIGESAKVY